MKKIIILLLTFTALGFSKDRTCDVNSTSDTVFVYCSEYSKIFGYEFHKLKMSKNGSYFEWAAYWGDDSKTLEIYQENHGDVNSLRIHIDKYGVESRERNFELRHPTNAWTSARRTLGF